MPKYNTPLVEDWTEEKCFQLIREYRKRPILWDQKDQYFCNRNMKPSAWEEIGDALNFSTDECQHKMYLLLASFRREKDRLLRSLQNLTGDTHTDSLRLYRSKWFAFEEMSFLMDKDSERKRQQNEGSDETDEDSGDEFTLNLSLLRQRLEQSSRPAKKRRIMSGSDETEVRKFEIHDPEPGPSHTTSEKDKEIISFTTFIGNKMKKYSDSTKNAVQQAICDIIFKADQNYYESDCYDKFATIEENADANPNKRKQTFQDVFVTKTYKLNYSDSD